MTGNEADCVCDELGEAEDVPATKVALSSVVSNALGT
jgi:hypothetical protein